MITRPTTYEMCASSPHGALALARASARIDATEEFYRFIEQNQITVDQVATAMGLTYDQLTKKLEREGANLDFLSELAHHVGAELHVTFRRKE